MMAELGRDAKIPDIWRMSALQEICPKDAKDQMLMRLNEVAENHERSKTNVISYSTNKADQPRVGQVDTSGPVDVDNVSCSERGDGNWEEQLWTDGTHCKRLPREELRHLEREDDGRV